VTPDEELIKRARQRLGTVLEGKYRLDSLLGFGGMAVVYRATHRNRAQFAVKMLHPELSLNAEVRARFLREGYAANSVDHPGAVRVVDDDVAEDGSAFLVMELLVGLTGEALLERPEHRIPVQAAAAIVHQLLDVLATAHAAGIVHRDIKPANIMVTRDGTVKVLDFGIARVLETALGAGQVTGGGLPLGTPAYMAPEQAVARSADIDAQTDVWAAGATFFTLASGELVHDGPTPAQILVYSATRSARSLADVAPEVPKAIVAVVDRALAFDKKDRWPSAAGMRDALADACRASFGALPAKEALAPLVLGVISLPPAPAAEDLASAPTLPSFPPAKGASTSSPVSGGRTASRPKRIGLAIPLLVAGAATALLALGVSRVGHRISAAGSQDAAAPVVVPFQRGPVLLLILGFENHTVDPVFDGTIACALQYTLSRSSKITTLAGGVLRAAVRDMDAEGATTDERVGPMLAARWGLRTVTVRGSVTESGPGSVIELTARDSILGVQVAALRETAETEEAVPAAVGRLAVALRTALDDAPIDAIDGARTGLSGSIEAIHEFSQGRDDLSAAKSEEGLVHMKRAVKLDPGFAEAHASAAVLLYNLERHAEAQRHFQAALEHLEGLSENRRLHFLGSYHLIMQEYEKAVPEFAALVARWPVERGSANNLAAAHLGMGDIAGALKIGRASVAAWRHDVIARSNLSWLELAAGELEAAAADGRGVYADFKQATPTLAAAIAAAEALQGHHDAVMEGYGKLRAADPINAPASEADFAAFEGRFEDAMALIREGIPKDPKSHSESAGRAWATMAELAWMEHDAARAKDAALHVGETSDSTTFFRAAKVLAAVGGEKLSADAVARLALSPGMYARLFSAIVKAEALRADGKARAAVEAVEAARPLGDFWLLHAALGQAALDAGSFDVANRELEVCVSRMGEGAGAFLDGTTTLRYLPGVRYALGRAREGLGRDDAKEAYAAFLAMEPAAQNDPLVRDAKKRLARWESR
jgi:eukaryotic-like serine/threonine-protein kinase